MSDKVESGNEHGAPRRRTVKPARVRVEELMDAAESLFLEKGFDATTIDDVVGRAGVAKGTFYHYFPSKNAVLVALRERFTRQFLARVQAHVRRAGADQWPARLAGWVHGSVVAYLETYRVHDLVFHAVQHGSRERFGLEQVIGPLRELLEQGAAAGAWTLDQPRLMTLMIYSTIHAAVDDAIARGELGGGKAMAQALTASFLRALGAPAGA